MSISKTDSGWTFNGVSYPTRAAARAARIDANKPPTETPTPKDPTTLGYVLKRGDEYLRRDQPRKPGDTAKYKSVERSKATIYKSLRQAKIKQFEAVTLQDGPGVQIEEVR